MSIYVQNERRYTRGYNVNDVKRGQVYYADLGNVDGSKQAGIRPVVIVSNDRGNRFGPIFTVISITSQTKTQLPTHVPVTGLEKQLSEGSIALCEQIITINKFQLKGRCGTLTENEMLGVEKGMMIQLGINIVNRYSNFDFFYANDVMTSLKNMYKIFRDDRSSYMHSLIVEGVKSLNEYLTRFDIDTTQLRTEFVEII